MPKLFIGNIPHASSEMELRQWVESRGFRVESAEVIHDKLTGKSRGFGFVTLIEQTNAQAAVSVLNGRRMGGRVLTVNEATPLTGQSPSLTGDGRSGAQPDSA
jgi:RNA recognition motif-containing protein